MSISHDLRIWGLGFRIRVSLVANLQTVHTGICPKHLGIVLEMGCFNPSKNNVETSTGAEDGGSIERAKHVTKVFGSCIGRTAVYILHGTIFVSWQ